MGKDLKGKELGTGLRQRKDGRYEARAKINGIDINLYDVDLKKLKVLLINIAFLQECYHIKKVY